jgi:hypothetical protein
MFQNHTISQQFVCKDGGQHQEQAACPPESTSSQNDANTESGNDITDTWSDDESPVNEDDYETDHHEDEMDTDLVRLINFWLVQRFTVCYRLFTNNRYRYTK